jgi:hypothetical protein
VRASAAGPVVSAVLAEPLVRADFRTLLDDGWDVSPAGPRAGPDAGALPWAAPGFLARLVARGGRGVARLLEPQMP